jgi:hypothetical protein
VKDAQATGENPALKKHKISSLFSFMCLFSPLGSGSVADPDPTYQTMEKLYWPRGEQRVFKIHVLPDPAYYGTNEA